MHTYNLPIPFDHEFSNRLPEICRRFIKLYHNSLQSIKQQSSEMKTLRLHHLFLECFHNILVAHAALFIQVNTRSKKKIKKIKNKKSKKKQQQTNKKTVVSENVVECVCMPMSVVVENFSLPYHSIMHEIIPPLLPRQFQ